MLGQQTWVLTGAGGRVASSLRPRLATRVAGLRLLDVGDVSPEHPGESFAAVDLRDLEALAGAFAGADGVLHFGGLSEEARFDELADVNITGTFNVLEAARRARVARVVHASSSRVTGFYPTTTTVTPDMPPRPDGLYGASKVAGEALGRMYADKFGLSVVAMRIGSFEPAPAEVRHLSTWLSPGDCERAVVAAMRAPGVGYAAFYAVSRNTRRWCDLAAGEALGFDPRDDAEDHAARVLARDRSPAPALQGGAFTSPDYTLRRGGLG
jgi:uronate dehydrogenase